MANEKPKKAKETEKLSKYARYLVVIALVCVILWFFKSVVVYIILAGVLFIIGTPISDAIGKRMEKHKWAVPICTLLIILGIFAVVVTLFILAVLPVRELFTVELDLYSIMEDLNMLANRLPGLGSDFRIETLLADGMQKVLNMNFLEILLKVIVFLGNMAIALASIIFISYFFYERPDELPNFIQGFLLDDISDADIKTTLGEIGDKLRWYLILLLIETIGVALLNFLGLLSVINPGAALSIAVFTGILNLIPYIGPLIGGILGIAMAWIIKSSSLGICPNVSVPMFIVIVVTIFIVTQIIDNAVFKSLANAKAIDAKPLIIFIVTIMGGVLGEIVGGVPGGMVGMFVAVPCYAVFHVVAVNFYGQKKWVGYLIPDKSDKWEPFKKIRDPVRSFACKHLPEKFTKIFNL